jgi:hypothetical protein
MIYTMAKETAMSETEKRKTKRKPQRNQGTVPADKKKKREHLTEKEKRRLLVREQKHQQKKDRGDQQPQCPWNHKIHEAISLKI